MYGSRFLGSPRGHRVLYFWHSIGNKLLTPLSNAFHRPEPDGHGDLLQDVRPRRGRSADLQSRDFGIEPEITCKIARMRARAWRCPFPSNGRTYEEGKKIGLKDVLKAVWTLPQYWRWKRLEGDVGAMTLRWMAMLGPHEPLAARVARIALAAAFSKSIRRGKPDPLLRRRARASDRVRRRATLSYAS